MANLQGLIGENGPHLTFFLKELKCTTGSTTIQGCTEEEAFSSTTVTYKGVVLNQTVADKLQSMREPFIRDILAELNSYFPENDLSDFRVMEPSALPNVVEDIGDYGEAEITNLAKMFGIPPTQAKYEWFELLKDIIESHDWCSMRKSEAKDFWAHYLGSDDVAVGLNIGRLIRAVLAIPAGSAHAERSFSILNHIRTKRRASLNPSQVKHLMRIRMNGPRTLEEVNFNKFAEKWLATGHKKTDDPEGSRKVQLQLVDNAEDEREFMENSFFDESAIF